MKTNLVDVLKDFVIRRHVVLASGRVDDIYVDIKSAVLTGGLGERVGRALRFEIYDLENELTVQATDVAGIGIGGALLVALTAPDGVWNGMVVRDAPHDHGTARLVEMAQGNHTRSVVVVEDVVTTGASALRAASAIEAAGFEVVGIVAVVDRRSERISEHLGRYPFKALFRLDELL